MQAKETILVVRVGRAGDMVMITPALDAILQRFHNADIHLLTSADGKRLLKNFDPRFARFYLYHRRFVTGWFRRRAVLAELQQHKFSHTFVFETNPHYHKLVQPLGGKSIPCDPAAPRNRWCTMPGAVWNLSIRLCRHRPTRFGNVFR